MQTLGGVHLLLVGDDADSRDVMKLIMEYQGALVLAVPDARSALAVLATMRPDAVVTDTSMMDHDGFAFVRDARKQGFLQGVPVVAVTTSVLSAEQIAANGFAGYLRKPLDPNELCHTVQAVVRRRPAHGP